MKIFLSVFLGIIAAFAVMRMWNAYGMTAVWTALAAFLVLLMVVKIRYWYRGCHGLSQRPDPHGRYYERWLNLKNCEQDYYPWLALEQLRERVRWTSSQSQPSRLVFCIAFL
jgi:hypothetical protein